MKRKVCLLTLLLSSVCAVAAIAQTPAPAAPIAAPAAPAETLRAPQASNVLDPLAKVTWADIFTDCSRAETRCQIRCGDDSDCQFNCNCLWYVCTGTPVPDYCF